MKALPTLGVLLAVLVGGGLIILFAATPTLPKTNQASGEPYKEIANPSGFVNTGGKSVTIGEYVGKKVILLDVMTYSCINCQRTFPYAVAWYEKYKDDGLIIIGIHTPEFAFEKDINNVTEAMTRFGITFPVVLDNDYGTWNAYGNRYWPRKYLRDIYGNVVYDHIGEGKYEETEMKIRELLTERAALLGMAQKTDVALAVANIHETDIASQSPETYFGAARNEYLANGFSGRSGKQDFIAPKSILSNALYLVGSWNISDEYAEASFDAKVIYKYNAKEVYVVADADNAVDIEVWQDGKKVTGERGADVSADGVVTIKESRLYKLIKNTVPGEHTLELWVGGTPVRFFAFTFG